MPGALQIIHFVIHERLSERRKVYKTMQVGANNVSRIPLKANNLQNTENGQKPQLSIRNPLLYPTELRALRIHHQLLAQNVSDYTFSYT